MITIRKTASVGKTENMIRMLLMPAPGEQIQTRTQERDAMFGRMVAASPGFVEKHPALAPLVPKTVEGMTSLLGSGTLKGTLVLDGRPLEAIGGLQVRSRLQDALMIHSNIGPGGATPEHQWRAAEYHRPFYALDTLTQVVEAMIREAVAAAVLVPRGADAGTAADDGPGASFP